METETEKERPSRRPTLASSWDVACGDLGRSLHVTAAALGAGGLDWDELLAPPGPGQDLVVLKRRLNSQGERPCFLYLSCDPDGGEEMCSVGILSSARNMEVYVGEEYCGTSRGQSVCGVPESRAVTSAGASALQSEHDTVFYKKYLKLESSTLACKIKLLSFGEKRCVRVGRAVAHVRPAAAESPRAAPALGARTDLQRVQAILESMGSQLSPGAQQLLSMVRSQQQNCVPAGEQLLSVLGNTSYRRMLGPPSPSASGALDRWSPGPFPFRAGWTPGDGTADLTAHTATSARPPGGGNTTRLEDSKIVPQNRSVPENELHSAVSAFLPKKARDGNSSLPTPELLPFLQNLCGQVNRLRGGPSAEWPGKVAAPSEDVAGVPMGEQPVCSYLEKILSKNMELLEKKLTDYIDQRIGQLQEHIDARIASLADSLQTPSPPPSGKPLRRFDSGEGLSNGER